MLMSIAYSMTATANNKDHLSAEKYKAISNIATLRKAGQISELGNTKIDLKPESYKLAPIMKALNASLSRPLSGNGSEEVLSKPATNVVKSISSYQDKRLTDRQ